MPTKKLLHQILKITLLQPKEKYMAGKTASVNILKLFHLFAEAQIDDLYEAMKSRSKKAEKYNLDIFESKVDPKTGETTYKSVGTTIIKGNKAYIVWAKYQNNPYFCRAEKIK